MLALLLVLGCPAPGTCAEEVEVVDLGETTSLGMSAADLLALVEGPRRAPMRYEGFLELPATWLDLELRWDGGEARLVHGVASGEITCPSRLEVDATWSLVSEDGALAETLPVTLVSSRGDQVRLAQEVALDALTGPWIDDGEPVVARVFNGTWEADEPGMGWVEHRAEYPIISEDGEDWVETEVYPVATWIEGEEMPG